MSRNSMEKKVLELFFNFPSKHWHFTELKKEIDLVESKLDKWLKKFQKEKIIKRIKEKGKMPYYISNYENSKYKIKKKIFALTRLYESGLWNHLGSLKKARTVMLFGSFSRSDWYKNSDIDIFIYGDPDGLKVVDYELKLHRDIQLFICQNKQELAKLGTGLIRNIIKGNLIKGDLDFIKIDINA